MLWQAFSLLAALAVAAPCNDTTQFKKISAEEWVQGMNPGWNLGNTLDATPTEGSWNNPPVQFSTFDVIKAKGFKGVRIPITYMNHFVSDSPTFKVNTTWLDRVEAVVDAALARGFYVVTNVHHDATNWADVSAASADYALIEAKFSALWTQIATRLAYKSERLSFETINEPPATTQQHYDEINKLNSIFIDAVVKSGGYNSQRVLNLVGPKQDGAATSTYFKKPSNITNPWAIQYHYYSPYDFIFSAWGKTIWGSDADKQALEADIASVRNNFTDIPLIIGEWSASTTNTETAARRKYNDFFVRTAAKYKTSTVLWDNGLDDLDRAAATWRDDTAIDIIMQANAGTANALGDSTTDTTKTSQDTSAYVFLRSGDKVTDQTLPFLFNGNTLKDIKRKSGSLSQGTDYTVAAGNITFSASYLSSLPTDTVGILDSLQLTFSSGAPYQISVVRYSTPELSSTSTTLASISGTQLAIPVKWNGIAQLATVRAQTSDNGYLADDYTQYFGVMADHRLTYNNHFSFDADNVILTQGGIQAVQAAKKTTTLTFEFYPRVPGHVANYTITV